MDISDGTSSREHDDFLIFVECLDPGFTLDNLVVGRVLELIQWHFRFLNLGHYLSIFRLGAPFAHCKDWTGFAELRKDQIAVFVKALKLLAESTAQSKRLDFDLQQKHVIAGLHEVGKVGHGTDVLPELSLWRNSDALICPVHVVSSPLASLNLYLGSWILGLLRDFLSDDVLITEALVVHTEGEELVEVKVVLHEESNVASLELHSLITEDFWVRPNIGIKGTWSVSSPSGVPLKATNANLESVHASAVVPQLLVAILCLVKPIGFVLEADWEATELCVYGDEVGREYWLNHKVELLGEIVHPYLHIRIIFCRLLRWFLFFLLLAKISCSFAVRKIGLISFPYFYSYNSNINSSLYN